MKVYKLTVMIIDRDRLGMDAAANELECGRFGNRCISPRVISASEADGWLKFDTIDQAKSAAQADFERRVRECIERELERTK